MRKVSPIQTRRGAEEYERQVRAALLNPPPAPTKEVPTLVDFVQKRWLPGDARVTNRASTIAEKERQLDRHILPKLGKLTLDKLGAEQVAAFFGYLRESGLSVKSCRNIGGVLHRALTCAAEWELIDRVPRFPRVKLPDAPWDFFTAQEVSLLLSHVADPFERAHLAPGNGAELIAVLDPASSRQPDGNRQAVQA